MNGTYVKFVNGSIVEQCDLGDKIERVIARIPGVKRLPCYENGKLKPESPCGKAKARLNAGEPIIPTIIKRIKGE